MSDLPNGGRESAAETISANPALSGGVSLSSLNATQWDKDIVNLIEGEDDVAVPPVGDDKPSDAEAASPRSWGFDVAEINRNYALAIWGGKAVVINEQPNGPVNDRVRVMSFESMNSWFANRRTEIVGADGKIKSVSWAKAWHSHRDRRQYDGIEFFPNPDGAPGTPNYLNFWRGFDVEPSPDGGTYGRFRDHLFINVCASDPKLFDYVFGWMAHLVQKPRERLGIALVLRGKRGTGKSKVGEVIGSLFSSHYFQVDDARYVTGQFNSHMASCLLLQSDEAIWAGDKGGEGRLKGLITSETQMIESKGVDSIRMRNFLRVIMTSNEGWVVPAGLDERRFCILDVGDASMQKREYFAEMDDELNRGGRARLLYDLLNFDLKNVDLWRVPQTQALLEQKVRSLDTIDDFWFNRLMEGDDWPARVVCADLYEEYIKASARIGVGRKRGPAEFGARLLKLAPEIRKSRPVIESEPGITKRAWCYDMPSLNDCRSMFEELLGQPIEWPALSLGEGERTECPPSDEVISV
ncbi:MAG: hypothetical protein J0I08_07640 [Rhizobiales bacterium]|nr:hypothetical protein [Hyphomicrobiales bacterium]